MSTSPAPVLSLADRRASRRAADPLAQAAAAGAALAAPGRLFNALSDGADFGGLDALAASLAANRDARHLGPDEYAALMERLAAAAPAELRAMLARLDATFTSRVESALEVGFHVGLAAGRTR